MDESSRIKTAHEWARDRLRQDIVTGIYPPGSPLKQTEIAATFGTSVTPVREAMRDLVGEGLVQVDPQRVARVREVDPAEAIEINEMRLLLEPLAARRAADRATSADVTQFRALAHEAEAAQEASDDAAWVRSNHQFHLAVIRSARSPRLESVLTNLREVSAFYLGVLVRGDQGIRARGTGEHEALIAAIESGDGERAAELMRAHLMPSDQLARLTHPHRSSSEEGFPADRSTKEGQSTQRTGT